MKGFNFERNLPHQNKAIESIIKVFYSIWFKHFQNEIKKNISNPIFDIENNLWQYEKNILEVQKQNDIPSDSNYFDPNSNIIDIMMETWTWKTYTYTKTIFELNKIYWINKFVIVVPTVSIKAWTISFLKSYSSIEHFKQDYWKIINLNIVEPIKNSKKSKIFLPTSIRNFVESYLGGSEIQVLLINAWMLNSKTLKTEFDQWLFGWANTAFDLIASVNPFVIVDEPHRFPTDKTTWNNIQKLNPQFILRFWATFKEFKNLIYKLTAIDAFNQNLVKWVVCFVEEFEEWKNVFIRFVSYDSKTKEANFEINNNWKKTTKKLTKWDSLGLLHPQFNWWIIDKLNKDEIIFTNWAVLSKWEKINPYSYTESLQARMIKKAIQQHFELEKKLLTQHPRIKPLTLFFIDDISSYRDENWYIKNLVEKYTEEIVRKILKEEKDIDPFYKQYLEKTLENISQVHWGYFSQDNDTSDEEIEKQINEILHDKFALLDLNNPRRFIFSKWTLREWWDNPNVFQICKLRTSGSEISKLQEVGRGLRLPVNEYFQRVKDKQFYLNYFVDFTEKDFVEKLTKEIYERSIIWDEETITKLDDKIIDKIKKAYPDKEDLDIILELVGKGIIDKSRNFKNNWFIKLAEVYPLAFPQLDKEKIRKSTDKFKKVYIRKKKFNYLKQLWEKINEKYIIEYKIGSEKEFENLLEEFFIDVKNKFEEWWTYFKKVTFDFDEKNIKQKEEILNSDKIYLSSLKYWNFLKQLASGMNVNILTLHKVFVKLRQKQILNINNFLTHQTINFLKAEFNNFLLLKSLEKLSIDYQKVSNKVYPNAFQTKTWKVRSTIDAFDIWKKYEDWKVADNYLFEELFFDSELEKENIISNIESVIVFTKIPKNSIKIPVPWWFSYSPDFAYVVKTKDWKETIHLIVETKDKEDKFLSDDEKVKIKLAEKFFEDKIKIKFVKQGFNEKMQKIIERIISN